MKSGSRNYENHNRAIIKIAHRRTINKTLHESRRHTLWTDIKTLIQFTAVRSSRIRCSNLWAIQSRLALYKLVLTDGSPVFGTLSLRDASKRQRRSHASHCFGQSLVQRKACIRVTPLSTVYINGTWTFINEQFLIYKRTNKYKQHIKHTNGGFVSLRMVINNAPFFYDIPCMIAYSGARASKNMRYLCFAFLHGMRGKYCYWRTFRSVRLNVNKRINLFLIIMLNYYDYRWPIRGRQIFHEMFSVLCRTVTEESNRVY